MQIALPQKEEPRPVWLFWDRLWSFPLPWQRGLFSWTPHLHLSLSLATIFLVASQNPFNPFPAETWFGILFVTLVEVAPPRVKTSVLGIFLFMMNNVGGNLPVLLDPLSKLVGYRSVWAVLNILTQNYREALFLLYPGMIGFSGLLFLLAILPLQSHLVLLAKLTHN